MEIPLPFAGVFILLASISFAAGRVHAAALLHNNFISTIMRAPLSFFDTTPMGRITNRFSRDIDMIDMHIPQTMSALLQTGLASLGSILVISISTPMFLSVLLPLMLLYYAIQVSSGNLPGILLAVDLNLTGMCNQGGLLNLLGATQSQRQGNTPSDSKTGFGCQISENHSMGMQSQIRSSPKVRSGC